MNGIGRIAWFCWVLAGAAHALYLGAPVKAFRVADGLIQLDGRPDSVWRQIAGEPQAVSLIRFDDYDKVVLLQVDSIRNAHPSKHFTAPSAGSVGLLAAYDKDYLYFYFLVRENNRFDPGTACADADIWKAHAVDLYFDTNPWSESQYTAYFNTDASGLIHGTSAGTRQMAKPIWPGDSRVFFRSRGSNNRFERTALSPTSFTNAVSASRTASDTSVFGVEMRFQRNGLGLVEGQSRFISWGYNHYPDGVRDGCAQTPIAYRWAKHYKTYPSAEEGPPGWRSGDSTHYDPTRSWDGWGRLSLEANNPYNGRECGPDYQADNWDFEHWAETCNRPPVVSLGKDYQARKPASIRMEPALLEGMAPRDIRGRLSPRGAAGLRILPLH
jgi:hypothetical protein